MKTEDFNGILKNAFNQEMHKDATPDGESHVKYYPFGDADKEVFLGGTCNGSMWRNEFVKHMDLDKVPCFNPVVEDWDDAAQAAEEVAKLRCGIHLYVITPKMTGTYAIAEAVKSAAINPKGTYFIVLHEDNDDKFNDGQLKSLDAVCDIIEDFGAYSIMLNSENDLDNVAKVIMKSKRGYANTMIVQMQSHPVKYAGVLGIQVYDLIAISKSIIKFFNDKFGSSENMETVRTLNNALSLQEKRTAERKARKVEGYNKK